MARVAVCQRPSEPVRSRRPSVSPQRAPSLQSDWVFLGSSTAPGETGQVRLIIEAILVNPAQPEGLLSARFDLDLCRAALYSLLIRDSDARGTFCAASDRSFGGRRRSSCRRSLHVQLARDEQIGNIDSHFFHHAQWRLQDVRQPPCSVHAVPGPGLGEQWSAPARPHSQCSTKVKSNKETEPGLHKKPVAQNAVSCKDRKIPTRPGAEQLTSN